jgi:hypothetical protein
MRFIDPDGMEPTDWFQNTKTGDVYYDPRLKKGDESQLGKSWEYLGGTGMFGKDDQLLIMGNKNIAMTGDVGMPVIDPNTGKNMGDYTAHTALFNGENAKSFMGAQGYNFKPITYKFYSDVTTENHSEGDIQVPVVKDNSRIEEVLTSRYIPQNFELKNTLTLGYYKQPINQRGIPIGPITADREQSWTKRMDVYGIPNRGSQTGGIFNTIEKVIPWKDFYENILKRIIK